MYCFALGLVSYLNRYTNMQIFNFENREIEEPPFLSPTGLLNWMLYLDARIH